MSDSITSLMRHAYQAASMPYCRCANCITPPGFRSYKQSQLMYHDDTSFRSNKQHKPAITMVRQEVRLPTSDTRLPPQMLPPIIQTITPNSIICQWNNSYATTNNQQQHTANKQHYKIQCYEIQLTIVTPNKLLKPDEYINIYIGNKTNYTIKNLQSNVTYRLRMRAMNSVGSSELWSDTVDVTTPCNGNSNNNNNISSNNSSEPIDHIPIYSNVQLARIEYEQQQKQAAQQLAQQRAEQKAERERMKKLQLEQQLQEKQKLEQEKSIKQQKQYEAEQRKIKEQQELNDKYENIKKQIELDMINRQQQQFFSNDTIDTQSDNIQNDTTTSESSVTVIEPDIVDNENVKHVVVNKADEKWQQVVIKDKSHKDTKQHVSNNQSNNKHKKTKQHKNNKSSDNNKSSHIKQYTPVQSKQRADHNNNDNKSIASTVADSPTLSNTPTPTFSYRIASNSSSPLIQHIQQYKAANTLTAASLQDVQLLYKPSYHNIQQDNIDNDVIRVDALDLINCKHNYSNYYNYVLRYINLPYDQKY